MAYIGSYTASGTQTWSSNPGSAWSGPLGPSNSYWYYLAATNSRLVIGRYANNGIWYSTNNGTSWTQSSSGAPFVGGQIAISSNGTYVLAGGGGSTGLGLSTNGASSFTTPSGPPAAGTWNAVCMSVDGSKQLAGNSVSGVIWYSSNYGSSWTQQSSAPAISWTWFACSSDESIVYGVYSGYIQKSTNNGSTWSSLSNSPQGCSVVACSSDGTKVYAIIQSGAHGLYYSGDSGSTWAQLSINGSTTYYLKGVACSSDGTKVIVADYGTSGAYVWLSTNSGSTWTQQSLAIQEYESAAMTADGSIYMVGTATGSSGYVYISSAPTLAWTVGNTSMANADFTVGASLPTTMSSVVTGFNGKSGNCIATSDGSTKITYTARSPGIAGNSYVLTKTSDTGSNYSFSGSTLSGGNDFLASGYLTANTIYKPSSTQSIVAGTGLTLAMLATSVIRIQGSGGPVTVTANPAIVAGLDGQMIIIEGRDNTNTVTFNTGNGLALNEGVPFTLGKGDILTLIYNLTDTLWYEVNRSNN